VLKEFTFRAPWLTMTFGKETGDTLEWGKAMKFLGNCAAFGKNLKRRMIEVFETVVKGKILLG
jgi:hypothetical protein